MHMALYMSHCLCSCTLDFCMLLCFCVCVCVCVCVCMYVRVCILGVTNSIHHTDPPQTHRDLLTFYYAFTKNQTLPWTLPPVVGLGSAPGVFRQQ